MSGYELDVSLEKKLFTPPDTPKYCKRPPVFVPAITSVTRDTVMGTVTVYDTVDWFDIKPSSLYVRPVDKPCTDIGEWWVQQIAVRPDNNQVILYRSFDGYIQEEYDRYGHLRKQDWLNRDAEPDDSIANWTTWAWHSNGQLAYKARQVLPVLFNDKLNTASMEVGYHTLWLFEEHNGKIVSSVWYSSAGERVREQAYMRSYHTNKIVRRDIKFYPGERWKSIRFINPVTGLEQAIALNTPSYATRNIEDSYRLLRYKISFGDTTVLHRTNGPAIYCYSPSNYVSKFERFYLAGKRYAKTDWLKQVSIS